MNKFLQEIYEQPNALAKTLEYYLSEQGKANLLKVAELLKSNQFERVIFTGMGSSNFISYSATCLLNKHGIKSFAVNAGELLHYQSSLLNEKTLLFCTSQSGESFEIVKILEKLPKEVTVIGLSNEENSSLVKRAKAFLLTKAGKEDMTSTKTFITSYMAIYLLSLVVSNKFNDEKIEELKKIESVVESLITNSSQYLSAGMKAIAHCPFLQLVGRGSVFASVSQGALMFMEATRNPASALLGGEFRHGPMEMVKQGFKLVLFAPTGNTYEQSIVMVNDIVKFGGQVLLLTNSKEEFKDDNICKIFIDCDNEELFAIPSIIPLQFIVNQWATEDGNEPGSFTRGAKVTVIE